MKKTIIITVLFMLQTYNLFATNSLTFLSHDNYKYKITYEIFTNIIAAFGKKEGKLKIEINSNIKNKKIAFYLKKEQLIVIDELVYNICIGFKHDSLNALAFIIGHELAHHFENLPEQESILYWSKVPIKSLANKATKFERITIEARADFIGGYYAYIAGYKSYNTAVKLYTAIYNSYSIPNQNNYYPSKNERENNATIAMNDLKKDIAIFEAAELLMFVNKYEEATKAFKFLYPIFPSRENANNVATALLLDIIKNNAGKLKYKIPLEFDSYTRMYGIKDNKGISSRVLSSKKINEAIEYLKVAIKKDTSYIPAYINICSAYYIKNNIDSAKYYLHYISKTTINNKNTQANLKTLEALIAIKENLPKKAEKNFILAKKILNDDFRNYNLNYFKGKKTKKPHEFLKSENNTKIKSIVEQKINNTKDFKRYILVEEPALHLKFKITENNRLLSILSETFTIKAINTSVYYTKKEYNKILFDNSFTNEFKSYNGFYRVYNNKILYFNNSKQFIKKIIFFSISL